MNPLSETSLSKIFKKLSSRPNLSEMKASLLKTKCRLTGMIKPPFENNGLLINRDDGYKWICIVPETFFQHDQSTDSAIIIFKVIDILKSPYEM